MGIFNRLYNRIVNKLRFARLSVTGRVKLFVYGSFFFGKYLNWVHNPAPLIFCMYSGPKYTHGLNTHYMNYSDKQWLGKIIYLVAKGKQIIDGYTLYKMLKIQRMNIVKTCYRVYFTSLCNYKLVGHGFNMHLASSVYRHPDSWLKALNESTSPTEIAYPDVDIAFTPTELHDRIIAAQNAVDITKRKISKSTGAFGEAPWKKH